jgi:hypothetical protein
MVLLPFFSQQNFTFVTSIFSGSGQGGVSGVSVPTVANPTAFFRLISTP